MTRIANATTEPEEHKEIEITPEIIEAGRRVFVLYDDRFERPADVVVAIFRAMWREKAQDIYAFDAALKHSR